MKRSESPPYWLAEGTETCEGCMERYVLQAELRCTGCDGAYCVHCVVVIRATREVYCATCAPHGGEG